MASSGQNVTREWDVKLTVESGNKIAISMSTKQEQCPDKHVDLDPVRLARARLYAIRSLGAPT